MRRRDVALGLAVIAAVFLLFVPVVHLGSFSQYQLGSAGCGGPIPCFGPLFYPAYRSFSCQTFGIGYMYSPYWGAGIEGVRAGCALPPSIPVP